uniref:Uncharacterized protein n=1 Tax=Rhizophora mucronata TaxID=61149 RepID=A0A2P2N007_RHIMU
MPLKKPEIPSVKKLSDKSMEVKESGFVNFGRSPLSLQPAR